MAWNVVGNLTGPTGPTGATGATGATGPTGPTGPAGEGASIEAEEPLVLQDGVLSMRSNGLVWCGMFFLYSTNNVNAIGHAYISGSLFCAHLYFPHTSNPSGFYFYGVRGVLPSSVNGTYCSWRVNNTNGIAQSSGQSLMTRYYDGQTLYIDAAPGSVSTGYSMVFTATLSASDEGGAEEAGPLLMWD